MSELRKGILLSGDSTKDDTKNHKEGGQIALHCLCDPQNDGCTKYGEHTVAGSDEGRFTYYGQTLLSLV